MRSHRRCDVAVSTREAAGGTVVAAREQSVRAGLEMLDHGGNAVDAAVSAALVAGVVEPTETTLAGSGFLLYNDGRTGPWSVNFGPTAPLAAASSMYEIDHAASSSGILGLAPTVGNANVDGPLAAGVPRTLLGLLSAHERWGALTRETICRPAIRAAHDGFPADTWFITSALSDLARLRSDPQSARTFLDDAALPRGRASLAAYGSSFDLRDTVRQPLLGATLEQVASGPLSLLVDGPVARSLVDTARDADGLLSLADMRAAAPVFEPARSLRYRDVDVSVPTAPGGGITELQILAVWQALNAGPSTSCEDPAQARALALAIRHAFADRYHWLGDPDVVPVPAAALLDDRYAGDLADLCATGLDVPRWGSGPPWTTYASTPAHDPWRHTRVTDPPRWAPGAAGEPTGGTTHISAADSAGRLVSITHTAAHHFGNGITCPRTGLVLDSAMAWFNAVPGAANSIAPGARALANMGPAVLTRDGRSVAALGASGGRRIISAVAQLIINMVDGGLSAGDALRMPRLEASGPAVLVDEGRAHDMEALHDLGAVVVPASNDPFTMDFARPNIAAIGRDGRTSSAVPAMAYAD